MRRNLICQFELSFISLVGISFFERQARFLLLPNEKNNVFFQHALSQIKES